VSNVAIVQQLSSYSSNPWTAMQRKLNHDNMTEGYAKVSAKFMIRT
jgi:hypothetical protein